MSALDLDALERLTRAYADAHAAMLADDRSAQAWLDDEAASKALAAHYGGQWASPAQCVDVLALITRLRAAEARTAWNFDMSAAEDDAECWAYEEYVTHGIQLERFFHAVFEEGAWINAETGDDAKPIAWMPLPAAPEAP